VVVTVDLTFLVGGGAGAGVMLAGRVASKILVRSGYWVYATNEYPSLIRGGHNWFLGRVCDRRVYSQRLPIDVIVALDDLTVEKHKERLSERGVIIAEKPGDRVVEVPLSKVAREEGAPPVTKNMVAIGALMGLLGVDREVLESTVRKEFARRGPKIAELNVKLASGGYEYGEKNRGALGVSLPKRENSKRMFLTGNDAIALGALAAGMKFFAAYPMTPASPILHFLAAVEEKTGIVAIQPENEIAAINMVIGAAYAGARSMTATSGGGFSLMVEALGQAGMTETPIVVVEAQRPGPSTGLPTHTAQGDLRFAMHASQGEFARFIIAPGDQEEAFYLAAEAFNLAEKYQVPAIILIDKYLGESYSTVSSFNTSKVSIDRGKVVRDPVDNYKRYAVTDDGVSPRAFPGTFNVIVRANSSEHTEEGYGSDDPLIVRRMVQKRMRKYEAMRRHGEERRDSVKTYGEGGDATLMFWGSVKGPALEAQRLLEKKGLKTLLVQVVFLSPLPESRVKEVLENAASPLILVENNVTGQLRSLLREYACIEPDEVLLKYDGRPFYPSEIASKILEVVGR